MENIKRTVVKKKWKQPPVWYVYLFFIFVMKQKCKYYLIIVMINAQEDVAVAEQEEASNTG